MSDEENKIPKQQEKQIPVRQPDTYIEKRKIDISVNRESPMPLSWQPIKDQTDSNPPDGGSGVGESKE